MVLSFPLLSIIVHRLPYNSTSIYNETDYSILPILGFLFAQSPFGQEPSVQLYLLQEALLFYLRSGRW